MREHDDPISVYLARLEEALGGRHDQSTAIRAEVGADLDAHVARLVADGATRHDAVRRALDGLGNPYELAHRMRAELPPAPPPRGVTIARRVLAGAVAAFGLLTYWTLRAGSYGFDPRLCAGVLLFHLPVVLLLWPGIVWRWNPLFGVAPALTGLGLAAFVVFGGRVVEQRPVIQDPVGPWASVPTDGDLGGAPSTIVVLVGLALVGAGLWSSMQQRRQRRGVLWSLAAAVVLVELPHQVEEWVFRREVRAAATWLDAERAARGVYPDGDAVGQRLPGAAGLWYRRSSDAYALGRARWLQPSCGLSFTPDGGIRAHD